MRRRNVCAWKLECNIVMIMKTRNIFYAALAAMAIFVSCEKPGPEGPDDSDKPIDVEVTFPAVVENYEVKPGATLELTFTPAQDWSLTVPTESLQWFWIWNGSFKDAKLTGKASEEPVTVSIGVSETEEFDTNRSCDVTLTMGDKSQVVAKYMRPAKERTMSVYMAKPAEDGGFVIDDASSYVYGTEDVTSVSLAWSPVDADFRAPIRVESNSEWTIKSPEWLVVNVPEKTAGVVELVLSGESLEEVSGMLSFMSGETVIKEIEVSLPSCKGMDVYSATVNNGEFEYQEGGEYVWSESPVEDVTLAWLGTDFRMPVKISSKCDWTLELPEWLTAEVPAQTAGEISFTLLGVPSKYPLEETSGKILFKSGETTIHEVAVTIPGCKDIMKWTVAMALTSLDYNAAGEVMTSIGYEPVEVTATIYGTSKTDVKAFEIVNGKYVIDSEPDWVSVKVSNFVTSAGADVLQERSVEIDVVENNGDERSGVIFFIPHSLSDDIASAFTEDMTAVKEEYQDCVIGISQLSNEFVISMTSTEEEMADVGASFTEASAEKKAELTAAFGATDKVYVLTYEDIYSFDEARMSMSRAYSDVKVFDAAKVDQSAVQDFWLAFMQDENNHGGVVHMYYDSDPANLPTLPTAPSTGYVVFYDATGVVLAIVECVSPYKEEEIITPPEDGGDEGGNDGYGNVYVEDNSYFSDPEAAAAAGAKLYKLQSGVYYDQYSEYKCPILLLEYTSVDTAVELTLPSEVKYWQVMPYKYNEMVTVNNETIYETSGIMESSTDKIIVRMTEEVFTEKEEIESDSRDKPAGLKIALHKDMSAQDPSIVIFCRLTISE